MVRRFVAIGAAALAVAGASAQGFSYASRSTPIRAGVLVIESQRFNGQPINPVPHVWGQLDNDRTVKPAEWTFVNPLAQSVLTVSQRARWQALLGSGVPPVGTRMTKRYAPYWEVNLFNISTEALSNFDVLLLSVRDGLVLTPMERERLRRFVDQGGLLWVDLLPSPTLLIDPANGGPVPFDVVTSPLPISADFSNRLLRFPNEISLADLTLAQMGGTVLTTPLAPSSLPTVLRESGLVIDSARQEFVVGNGSGSLVSIAQIGDGFVLTTTRGFSLALNRGIGASQIVANTGFESLPSPADASFVGAAKLIVNAIHYANQYASVSRGTRRTGSSPVDLTAPLLRNYGVLQPDGSPFGFQPESAEVAVFGGRVAVVSNNRLVVLDAKPNRDLDGDGDIDDGLPDPIGYDADLLWQSQPLGPSISAPTCVEVPDSQVVNPARGGAVVTNMVMVVEGAGPNPGRVLIFDLDHPADANAQPVRIVSPSQPGQANPLRGPQPVTVSDGIGFVTDVRPADGLARVWAFELASPSNRPLTSVNAGGAEWVLQGSARVGAPAGPPTVGLIPIFDGSGGSDRVVYIPCSNNTAGDPGPDRPAGLASIWWGARGENPPSVSVQGTQLVISTRAAFQGLPVYSVDALDPLNPRLSVFREASGDPLSPAELDQVFAGQPVGGDAGTITVQLGPGAGNFDFDGTNPGRPRVIVRVDYVVDWGRANAVFNPVPADAFVRGNLELPDTNENLRRIQGSLALGPNGNLFLVTSGDVRGGTLFALREEGRGDFKLLYRYDLTDRINILVNGQPVRYESSVIDVDDLVELLEFGGNRFLDGPIFNLRFSGGPTVTDQYVYVLARGVKQVFFPIPISVLMVFDANPKPMEFVVENLQPGFSIFQPDPARSIDSPSGPPPGITTLNTFSVLQPGEFTFEQDPEFPQLSRIRIENAMTVTRGRVRDSISASLPLIIRRGGSADLLVEPEASAEDGIFVPGRAGGRYSPLRWYVVFNGGTSYGQPLVTGRTVYAATSSVLPSLIGNGTPFPARGILFGIDAFIAGNDPFLRSVPSRPWQRQLSVVRRTTGFPPFEASPSIRWPQPEGVTSFFDFRIRLLQNALEDNAAYGVAGGDGVLVSWGANRVYAFSRADFSIADEQRIGRYDSNGNPIWVAEETLSAGTQGPIGAAGNLRSLSRPSRIYRTNENGYLVVDRGNDRVVRLDAWGRETRSIESFKLDPRVEALPAGVLDNPNFRLRQPTDAITYTTRRTLADNPFSNAFDLELWVHYLIADTGNARLLELVDRYRLDPQTGRIDGPIPYFDPRSSKPTFQALDRLGNPFQANERALGVLLWHSPSEFTGKQYSYNSIARVFVPGTGGNRAIFAFGFGNVQPGRSSVGLDSPGGGTPPSVDIESGTGGVILFDGAQSEVITEFDVPAIPANVFYNPLTGQFDAPARPAVVGRRFAGLTSVSLRYVPVGNRRQLAVMVTDSSGVYELVQVQVGSELRWTVRWMLPNEAYVVMRRQPNGTPSPGNPAQLRAMYAERLDSGDVLLVNGYVGQTRGGNPFNGEVVILDGSLVEPPATLPPNEPGFWFDRENLGFMSLSVKFRIPPVVGARGLVAPIFAEKR